MSCGVGCRCSSDLVLLWLWHRLVATAPIQPLAWEAPYVVGVVLKSKQQKKCVCIYIYIYTLLNKCFIKGSGQAMVARDF